MGLENIVIIFLKYLVKYNLVFDFLYKKNNYYIVKLDLLIFCKMY